MPTSHVNILSTRLVLILLGLLGLSACDRNPDEDRLTPQVTPEGQWMLRKANGAEPQTLDPHKAQDVPSANILRDLYEGLISETPAGELAPGVAERWTVSADDLTYTFALRADARWSNGTPITAGDFVYALRRSVDPATGSSYSAILTPIQNAEAIIDGRLKPEALGVEAPDPQQLKITLKAPTPYFLELLTHSSTYPVYQPAVKAHGDAFTQPPYSVTNGAYRLKDWTVASQITLERNPAYWDDAHTRIGRVQYFPIEDTESEFKRYRAGELDWTNSVPTAQLDRVRAELPEHYHASPYLGVYYYGLNLTRSPFKDNPGLRRALSLAVDRDILVEKITRGGETAAYGWVPPGVKHYEHQYLDYTTWPQAKRLEEARRLYHEAGYSTAKPLEVEIRYNTSDNHRKLAQAIASMWKTALGVEATLYNEEWKVFLQNVQDKRLTQAYRASWTGDYNDPYTFLELLHAEFGLNGTGYRNPAYDRLVEEAAMTSNPDTRRQHLAAAERQLLADHPVIPLYFYVSQRLIKPYVHGYQPHSLDHHYTKHLWIEPAATISRVD